jgi:excisionase family DNA binding protein
MIRELCEMRGIKSAYELAKRSKLKMPTAYRAFSNNIKQFTLETLEALCNALDCSPNDIFGVEAVKVEAQKPVREPVTRTAKAIGSDLLTTIEVAERLGLSRKRVNDYVTSGELRSVKGKGNHNFISEVDYLEFEFLYRQSKNL